MPLYRTTERVYSRISNKLPSQSTRVLTRHNMVKKTRTLLTYFAGGYPTEYKIAGIVTHAYYFHRTTHDIVGLRKEDGKIF